MTVRISRRFKDAIKLSHFRQYKLAVTANLHPSSLSLLLNDGRKPRLGDPRLLKIAKLLNFNPSEIFEEETT